MSEIPRGAIRFNTDSNKPELWDGSQWAEFQLSTPNLGTSADTQPGARGIFVGGRSTNTIEYINVSSTGNALDFGDTTENREGGVAASSTRGLSAGSYPSVTNTIDFITIASTGNAANFGDLTAARRSFCSCSSSTRGVFTGGIPSPTPTSNIIDYVTIASTGNANDFGDLVNTSGNGHGMAGSPTRGLVLGGTPSATGAAQFITIATTGSAQIFGDLSSSQGNRGSCSNATRALHAYESSIEYVTIASLGNGVNFGSLSNSDSYKTCLSDQTRGVWSGGSPGKNIIEYVTISDGGSAVDFGDLNTNKFVHLGYSNAHGGL
jgi:hypothetical protein